MSIAFSCPHCQKPYKVKDELAGKRATCTQCKKVMQVPTLASATGAAAGPAPDAHLLETMATATLTDEPAAAPAAEATGTVTTECAFCFETVTFPATLAGKKSPCPSCRRIIPVPALPEPKKAESWREKGTSKRFGERVDAEAAPEGVWGTTELGTAVVSRDSLEEAGAVDFKRRVILTTGQKVRRGLFAAGVVALMVAGFFYSRQRQAVAQRGKYITDAVAGVDAKAPAVQQAALHRAVAEVYLRQTPADYPKATKHLKQARAQLTNPDGGLDRLFLLGEVALLQAELGGDATQVKNEERLPWEACQKEVRQTLDLIARGDLREGREFALWTLARLTRTAGLAGARDPMVLALGVGLVPAEERAEARGVVGLELLALGDAGRQRAEAIATEDREGEPITGSAVEYRTALAVALGKPDKKPLAEPTGGEPSLPARVAYATGFGHDPAAHDKARRVAELPGAFEAKLAGYVQLADARAEPDAADVKAAAEFAAGQLERFSVSPVTLVRLADACRRANQPALIDAMAAKVTNPQARGWMELMAVRARHTADVATAEKAGEAGSAAQALAVFEAGRHLSNPKAAAGGLAHDGLQPFAFAGAALGK